MRTIEIRGARQCAPPPALEQQNPPGPRQHGLLFRLHLLKLPARRLGHLEKLCLGRPSSFIGGSPCTIDREADDEADDFGTLSIEDELAAYLGPETARLALTVLEKYSSEILFDLLQSEEGFRQLPSGTESHPASSSAQTTANSSSPATTVLGSGSTKRQPPPGAGRRRTRRE